MKDLLKDLRVSPGLATAEAAGKQQQATDEGESRAGRLSLRANFVWTFAGNSIYAACQWGMLVALAKLGSTEMVGQFALALAVTAPILMFTNLQLRTVQATDARQEYAFSDYLGLRLAMTGLALLAIAAVTLALGYRLETAMVVLAMGLAKCIEAISDVFFGLMQQYERMDRIAISMIVKGVLSLVVLVVGVYLTNGVFWGVVGLAAAWTGVLIFYDIRNGATILKFAPRNDLAPAGRQAGSDHRTLRPRWNNDTVKRLLALSIPLGVVMLLISLNGNIPRYFIEHFYGEQDLGIFAALSYLIVVGTTVVFALGQAASPRLARHYALRDVDGFTALLAKLVLVGLLLGLAGTAIALVAGAPLLTLIYRPEYATDTDVFVWLMAGAGVLYVASFLGYGMSAARYFKQQAPLFLLVTAATALACLALVPGLGLIGAAYATLIGAAVQLVGSLFVIMQAVRRARHL